MFTLQNHHSLSADAFGGGGVSGVRLLPLNLCAKQLPVASQKRPIPCCRRGSQKSFSTGAVICKKAFYDKISSTMVTLPENFRGNPRKKRLYIYAGNCGVPSGAVPERRFKAMRKLRLKNDGEGFYHVRSEEHTSELQSPQ